MKDSDIINQPVKVVERIEIDHVNIYELCSLFNEFALKNGIDIDEIFTQEDSSGVSLVGYRKPTKKEMATRRRELKKKRSAAALRRSRAIERERKEYLRLRDKFEEQEL